MPESGAFTFSDADNYAAAFGNVRVDLTITGPGDFKATLAHLKLDNLDVYYCRETLPRIAYISLPPGQVFLSFPVGSKAPIFRGYSLRDGELMLHSCGDHFHQRSMGECQWGLIALAADLLANSAVGLTGSPPIPQKASRVLRPAHAEALRFQHLFKQACRLAGTRGLIRRPDVVSALEQKMLQTIVRCISGAEANDNARMRSHHTVIVHLEGAFSRRLDRKISIPKLCTELGVPERSLRMCCAKVLGVSPTRYL